MLNNLTSPKISLLYAGVLGLMYIALSLYVIRQRWVKLKGLGHDQDPKCPLFRAVRIHGNFSEYVPLLLLFLTLDEMTGRSTTLTHTLGMTILAGRVGHFIGIRKTHGTSPARFIGVSLTFVSLITLSAFLIIKGVA